jgi:hypothetical protein
MKYPQFLLALAALSASLILAACGGGGATTKIIVPPPAGTTSVQVLFPPTNPSDADYAAVQTYLMTSQYVSGAVIDVDWSDFDIGSAGAHTNYDYTITDAAIQPWISAGKKVNLVLQNTTYAGNSCPSNGNIGSNGQSGVGNCAMPPWMWTALGSSNYTTCTDQGNTQQVPNWRSTTFVQNYKNAIQGLIAHYGSNSSIGYIRIGLGKGGEINLPSSWTDTSTPCGVDFTNNWGYTAGADGSFTWNAYLQSMVQYEGGLGSPKKLLVSITPISGVGTSVDDFIAPIAVQNGLSYGNQGLEASDISNFPNCGGDWCNLFAQYPPSIAELQTLGRSCPPGNTCGGLQGSTGNLVPLIPFAVNHGATDLELYYEDWLIAFDSSYASQNGASGAASSYASAIQAVASGK